MSEPVYTLKSLFYSYEDPATHVTGLKQYESTDDIFEKFNNVSTTYTSINYIHISDNFDGPETLSTDFKITCPFTISPASKPIYVKSGTAINVNTGGNLTCEKNIFLQNKSIDSHGNKVTPGLLKIDGGRLEVTINANIESYKGIDETNNNSEISTSDKNDYGTIQFGENDSGIFELSRGIYVFNDIQLLLKNIILKEKVASSTSFYFQNSFIDYKIIKNMYPSSLTEQYGKKYNFTNCEIIGNYTSSSFSQPTTNNGYITDSITNYTDVTLNNSKVNLTQSNENLTNYSIKFTNLTSNQSEIINTFDEANHFWVYFNGATFTDTQFKFLNGLFCVGKGTTMNEGIKMDGEGSFRCVNSIIYLGGVNASDNIEGKLTIDLPYPIYLKSCNIKLNPDSSLKINECIDVLPMCFLDRNSNISIDSYDGVDNYTAVDFSTDTNKHYLSELGIYIDKGALSGINSKITTLEKDSQLHGDQLGIIRSKIGIDQYGEQIDSGNTTILNRLDTIQNYIGITNEGGNNDSTNGLMDTVKNYGDQLGIIRGKMGINENGSYVGSTNNNDTENMLSRLNAIQKTIGINNLGVQNDSVNLKSVLIRLDAIQNTVGINASGSQQTGAGYETTILNRLDNYKGRINNTETKIGINENGSQQTGVGYETTILNRLDDYKIRIGNAEKNIGIDAFGTPITSDNTTILKRLGTIQDYIGITNDGKNDTTTDRLMDTVEEYGKQIGHLKTNVGIDDNGEPINSTDPNKPNILQRLNTNKTQIGYLKTKVGINDDGVQQKGDSYKTSILNRLDRTESNIGIDNKGDKLTGEDYESTILDRLDDHDSRINVNKNNISINTTQIGYLKTNVGINDNGNQTPSTNNEETETMLNRLDHIQKTIGIDNLGVQDNTINDNSVLIRLDNYKNKISTNTTQIGYLKTNVGINDNGEPIKSTDPNKPNILERLGTNETQIGYLKTNVGINDSGVQQKGDSYKTSILNRLDRTESNIGIDNEGDKLTGEDYESTILDRLDTAEYDIDMLYDYDNTLSEVLDVDEVKKLLEKKNYEFDDVLKYIVDIIENRHSDLRSINMKMLILSILANKQKFLNN